jgi:hypothetical protein
VREERLAHDGNLDRRGEPHVPPDRTSKAMLKK